MSSSEPRCQWAVRQATSVKPGRKMSKWAGMTQRRQVERPDWRQLLKLSKESTATVGKLVRTSQVLSWRPDDPHCLLMTAFCEKTTLSQSGRLESGALTG